MKKFFAALVTFFLAFAIIGGFYFGAFTDAKAAVSDKITLNSNYLGLEVNQKRTLIAYLSSSNPDHKAEWSSSDTQIAQVSPEGVVTALSVGTATISASVPDSELHAECTVNVFSGHINGEFDFSESNMITNSSFEDPFGTYFSVDDGGNTSMAIAYLTRWDGAVLEEKDSFPLSTEPEDLEYKELEPDYHLSQAIFIPNRNSYLDNNRIKEAIINYGAVYASFAVNNKCFDFNSTTYYRPDYLNPVDGGHAIAIVGWDDNYSRYNFEYTPDGDGAFICKNSWGTSSGENGYLYISYYDASIGKRDVMTAYTGLSTVSEYNKIYQYDPFGFIDTLYGSNENTIYAANVFPESSSTLSSDEVLKAVSFYTYSENTEYEVFAVTDFENKSALTNNRTSLKSGILEETGYHTIEFDPVTLSTGTRFAVIVKLKTDNESSRFYAEAPVKDYSEGARANSGESFFAFDGNDWQDLTDSYENYNFCIKAFTLTNEQHSNYVLSGTKNDIIKCESDKIYTVNELSERKNSDINPEFVDYINELDSSLSKSTSGGIKHSAIPSPITVSSSSEIKASYNLPSEFNLKDENSLTSVKRQGNINGCWAFATYASLESCLLRNASNLTGIPQDMTSSDEIDCIINASNVKLEKINLNLTENEILVEEEFRLTAKPYPVNAKLKEVKWYSSDPAVATVNPYGKVIARRPGTAEIFAENSDGTIKSYCVLNIKPRLFCITWNVDNKLSTQLIYEYSEIKPNITPEKTGYTFVGWEPELPETMPSENLSFNAVWKINKYNSFFYANGGSWNDGYNSKTVITDFGKKLIVPESPSKEGYDFIGWDVNIPSAMPAEELTFNAKWHPRNDTKYKVNTYIMNSDGNYNISSEIMQGTTDETVTLSVPKTDKGFYFNSEKSVISGKIDGDGSLVLQIYIDRQKYTLKTVSDGAESTAEYLFGQSVAQPQAPYKNGYHFIGWSPEVPAKMPANDITLHAVFKKIYSVSIKNNSGSKSINYGETLVLTAGIDELPENTVICWYVKGSGFKTELFDNGKKLYVTAVGKGTVQVTVTIEQENGDAYLNPDGKEVCDSQTISSNAGFLQKLISFFKNLFGINRLIIQNLENTV